MPLNLAAGLCAALLVLVVPIVVRFGIEYVRSDGDTSKALKMTNRWVMAIATAVGGLAATGVIQFGDLLGSAFSFVVNHPFVVSNLGITGVGVAGLSGAVGMSADQFVGVALLLVGLVFLSGRVDDVLD